MNRNRTWFNTMVKSWLETEPKRSPKVLENVIETRKKLRQYLKQLKLDQFKHQVSYFMKTSKSTLTYMRYESYQLNNTSLLNHLKHHLYSFF